MIKDRASYIDTPGLRDTMEKVWRPLWKGMGIAQVASEAMAGRGPAVDDGGWAVHKRNEALLWINEELARRARHERLVELRSWGAFAVSVLALLIAIAALLRK